MRGFMYNRLCFSKIFGRVEPVASLYCKLNRESIVLILEILELYYVLQELYLTRRRAERKYVLSNYQLIINPIDQLKKKESSRKVVKQTEMRDLKVLIVSGLMKKALASLQLVLWEICMVIKLVLVMNQRLKYGILIKMMCSQSLDLMVFGML